MSNVASKQTYPCFACRKAGYEVLVYLDGKDEQGRTKYLNEDGTKHFHKTKAEAGSRAVKRRLTRTRLELYGRLCLLICATDIDIKPEM